MLDMIPATIKPWAEPKDSQRKAEQAFVAPPLVITTPCDPWPRPYYIEDGLRKVHPYHFTYKTNCKERWRGRELLDIFATEFRDRSQAYYKDAIERGNVVVNGARVPTVHSTIKNGDIISHTLHRHEPPVTAQPIGVIHEDNDMVVINKPAGVPVHPAGRYNFNSIIEIMRAERSHTWNPLPCHRLDRLTSGVMFIGKNARAAEKLSMQIRGRSVKKEYVARVIGEFPEGDVVCEQPIMQIGPKLGLNRARASGKEAKTAFKRLAYYPPAPKSRDEEENTEAQKEKFRDSKMEWKGKEGYSIVRCRPVTGRTHQLRVHLQFLGHPIANDPIYCNQRVFGPSLAAGDALPDNDEDIISRLSKMGKSEVAEAMAYHDEMMAEYNKRKAEKLTGYVCEICDTPLYSDPGAHELGIYLHARRYACEEGRWEYETPLPEWALPPPGTAGPTEVTEETDPLHGIKGLDLPAISDDESGKKEMLEHSDVERGKLLSMDALFEAVETTPIIDHHAHNLLQPSAIDNHDFMAATSEATGPALKFASSTLSHLRALRQLAEILGCESTWEAVESALKMKRKERDDAWARKCFQGIETVLIDDGLDPSNVYPYNWHNRLTRSKCKRIVRIEKLAEEIMTDQLEQCRRLVPGKQVNIHAQFVNRFITAIEEADSDPEVAGFKSVICYRVGLKIPAFDDDARAVILSIEDLERLSCRFEDERMSPYLVHLNVKVLERRGSKKPLQFHTGLGDNDIDLELSNPSHLQGFIESYPNVRIVLLHASYPFTREAGYLASVYNNCWLDIGEVFPMVSQDGQEKVIGQALELCPSEKLTWSTDGHWFPETYLLAVMQIREGLLKVLSTYIERGSLTIPEAVKIVQDMLFNTANQLYSLKLSLVPVRSTVVSNISSSKASWTNNFTMFQHFLEQEPSVRFLRLQWLDYTNTLRLRILPIKQALRMFSEGRFIGIVEAVFGLLQVDHICPGFSATNEYDMYPQFAGLRLGSRKGDAIVQCEFRGKNGEELPICPRTSLRRQVEKAGAHGVEFLVGFEIEIVFMSKEIEDGELKYGSIPITEGHAWSTARALHSDDLMDVLETIFEKLERAGLNLEQFHPESSAGQFEFILSPLSPVFAVDALMAAKEIIQSVTASAGMRATLFPKPFPQGIGTGAHIHISLTPAHYWETFYAGVLKHLRAIAAFSYSNDASYERVADGVWAGSTWIAWGTQNRETPLRRIGGSHFEIRCVDGLSNPYLVLAAIVGAGLQGILDKESLQMKDCPSDPATLTAQARKELGITEQFPKSIGEALSCLEADEQLHHILSKSAVETYLTVKRAESEMLQKIEPTKRRIWLIERY